VLVRGATRRNPPRNAAAAEASFLASRLTGTEVDERDAFKLTIVRADASREQVVVDVNAAEVADLAAKETRPARRSRKPKNV
jgi:hypothetical protein